jgi:hypothetical protein
MSRLERRRVLKGKIRVVADALHRHWDPIGAGVPADEYDSYAPVVTGMVERGKTDHEIAAHLAQIEEQLMGLQPRQISELEQVVRDSTRIGNRHPSRHLTHVAADKHFRMRLRRNGGSVLAAELRR